LIIGWVSNAVGSIVLNSVDELRAGADQRQQVGVTVLRPAQYFERRARR
jgi:hypothetical protein